MIRIPQTGRYTRVDREGDYDFIPTLKYVYLAESTDCSLIKIGYSYNPPKRLKELRRDVRRHSKTASSLRLIGVGLGTYRDEERLLRIARKAGTPVIGGGPNDNHAATATRLALAEWFAWSADLLEHLKPHFPLTEEFIVRDGKPIWAYRALELLEQEQRNA